MENKIYFGYREDAPPVDKEFLKQAVGPGWSGIIDRLVDDLFALGWDGHVHQVKEKFGGLRFYIGGLPEETFSAVVNRISEAENESLRTCDECGKPGRPRSGGWIRTLCDEHEWRKI